MTTVQGFTDRGRCLTLLEALDIAAEGLLNPRCTLIDVKVIARSLRTTVEYVRLDMELCQNRPDFALEWPTEWSSPPDEVDASVSELGPFLRL